MAFFYFPEAAEVFRSLPRAFLLVPHRRVLTPMNETGYESRRSLEHRGRIFYGA